MEDVLALLFWLATVLAQSQSQENHHHGHDSEGCSLQAVHRPFFHITAPVGWLNNPAGLAYFRGQYHVFYQFHPYSNGTWGYMHWGHTISDDLVFWTTLPAALSPRENYESYGCLAGSALVHKEYLTLVYTGIHESKDKGVIESQNVALSTHGVTFNKYNKNPIIIESPYAHMNIQGFRNPKVWGFHTTWYMIVGAMSDKQRGQLLLYTSSNMLKWEYNGTIAESYGEMGYMWECPDYFELDGSHVLMMSARGIEAHGFRFRNIYQTGYVLGDLNYRTGKFNDPFELSTATFNELDYGHDFYGARTVQAADGRTLLIAWLGMEEISCEETVKGWASMLTIFRELRLSTDGRILMTPLTELENLRTERLEDAWYKPGEDFITESRSFELLVNTSAGANEVEVMFEVNGVMLYFIWYSAKKSHLTVDRGGIDGVRRASWAPRDDLVNWRIFFDKSSIELFSGTGDVTFSSRVFPSSYDRGIRIKVGGDTMVHMIQFKLKQAIRLKMRD